MKNINVNSINYCITLISYLIYKYWLKVLNTNKVKNKRNFYNFLSFELNNRVKILQNTSEHTLHCCKKLTLILHVKFVYISKLRPRLKLISDASYTFFRVFNRYFYSLFFSMYILSLF